MKKIKDLNDLYNSFCDYEIYNGISKDDLLKIAKELIFTLAEYEPSKNAEGVLIDTINNDILYIDNEV